MTLTPLRPEKGQEKEAANEPSPPERNSQADISELTDEALQAKYRAAYLDQLRRRSCPGCGEGEILG